MIQEFGSLFRVGLISNSPQLIVGTLLHLTAPSRSRSVAFVVECLSIVVTHADVCHPTL